MFAKISRFLKEGHWDVSLAALPAWKRWPLAVYRFACSSLSIFTLRRGKLHAGALTYFTLTTVVPIFCLLLLAAKYAGFGEYAREHINAYIDETITAFERDAQVAMENEEAAEAASRQAAPGAAETVAPQDGGAAAAQGAGSETRTGLSAAEKVAAKSAAAGDFARQARDFSNKIFDQIRDFDVGTLGWAGLLLLLWAVIGTLGSVEQSFNDFWDVEKPRSFFVKTWYYLLVLAILPVLVCAASAVPIVRALSGLILSCIEYIPYADTVTGVVRMVIDSPVAGSAITLLASALSFAFFLWAMPNAKTKFRPAFASGLLTSILFAAWLKICAVAQVGISNASAIYGSFSLLPILLAWVYVSWEVVLLGSAFSRVFQNGVDKRIV